MESATRFLIHDLWPWLSIVLALGLLIFVHELGHFMVAKWVRIRVEVFSLGFGPRLFGWRRDRAGKRRFTLGAPRPPEEGLEGATDYRLSVVPFGGYVKMAGETPGDGRTGAPYEFASKTPLARFAVIVAGVTMNGICAFACFVVAFGAGARFTAPVVGAVDPGTPAWEAGWRPGDQIRAIDGEPVEDFEKITAMVAHASREAPLRFEIEREGRRRIESATPAYREDLGIQTVGIAPQYGTVISALVAGGAAERARLRLGDAIRTISATEGDLSPSAPQEVATGRDVAQFMAAHPRAASVTLQVGSADGAAGAEATRTVNVPVTALCRWELGIVERVGLKVAKVQRGSSAEAAGIAPGDWIMGFRLPDGAAPEISPESSVEAAPTLPADDAGFTPVTSRNLLLSGLRRAGDRPVALLLSRGGEKHEVRVITDPDRLLGVLLDSAAATPGEAGPAPAGGGIVGVLPGTPAERAGMQAGDEVLAISISLPWDSGRRDRALTVDVAAAERGVTVSTHTGGGDDQTTPMEKATVLSAAAQFLDGLPVMSREDLSRRASVNVRFRRAGLEQKVSLTPVQVDRSAVLEIAGFEPREVLVTRDTILGACALGVEKTGYMVQEVFRMVRSLFTGRIAAKHLGGPGTIGVVVHKSAQKGLGRWLYILGMLGINLAVINLFPIPVLDGGHLVFILVEKLKGSPVSERVQQWATIAGMVLLFSLMLLVLFNDYNLLKNL
ncbi:MAG: site-2 protease family protein [Planctomycetes bacterium]|nr:site-2 protease family protein [Planctomycetota bacterium]